MGRTHFPSDLVSYRWYIYTEQRTIQHSQLDFESVPRLRASSEPALKCRVHQGVFHVRCSEHTINHLQCIQSMIRCIQFETHPHAYNIQYPPVATSKLHSPTLNPYFRIQSPLTFQNSKSEIFDAKILRAHGMGTPQFVCIPPGMGTPQFVCIPPGMGTPQFVCIPHGMGTPQFVCIPHDMGTPQFVCIPSGMGTPQFVCIPPGMGTPQFVCIPPGMGTPQFVCIPHCMGTPQFVCISWYGYNLYCVRISDTFCDVIYSNTCFNFCFSTHVIEAFNHQIESFEM